MSMPRSSRWEPALAADREDLVRKVQKREFPTLIAHVAVRAVIVGTFQHPLAAVNF
jgi:hypothetical protein